MFLLFCFALSHFVPFCFLPFLIISSITFLSFFLSSCYSLIIVHGIFCYSDLHSRGFLRVSWQIVKQFFQSTRRNILEEFSLHQDRCGNRRFAWFVFTDNNIRLRVQVVSVQTSPLKMKAARSFQPPGTTNTTVRRSNLNNTTARISNLGM